MKTRVYNTRPVEDCGYYPRFVSLFRAILNKDYPGKEFGFTERVLNTLCVDMDAVEIAATGDNDCTMDCVVGVGNYEEGRKIFSSHRVMMVEMKLGCTSFSLKSGDLQKKELHTMDLLTGNMLESARVFLFTSKVISEAKRRLNSWKRGSEGNRYKNWCFLEPKEYNDFIHFAEDYPYLPVNKRADIVKSFENTGSLSENIDSLVKIRNYWLTLANDFRNRGVQEEHDHIKSVVEEVVSVIVNTLDEGDDKELLKLEFQI